MTTFFIGNLQFQPRENANTLLSKFCLPHSHDKCCVDYARFTLLSGRVNQYGCWRDQADRRSQTSTIAHDELPVLVIVCWSQNLISRTSSCSRCPTYRKRSYRLSHQCSKTESGNSFDAICNPAKHSWFQYHLSFTITSISRYECFSDLTFTVAVSYNSQSKVITYRCRSKAFNPS